MTLKKILLASCLAMAATFAVAHDGVEHPAVDARMHNMGEIGTQAKLLGQMSKRQIPFDRTDARHAASEIARLAAEIGALFAEEATDPQSEALPDIWTSFDSFKTEAELLRVAAADAATGIDVWDDLSPAMAAIGKSCGSCHQSYRE